MFKFLSIKEQLMRERKVNEQLSAQLAKATSDLDYLAMMTDIELAQDEMGEIIDE